MKIRTAFCALTLALTSTTGEAADRITWLHPEFPPSYIGAGEFEGQGYLDQQLAFLQTKLPGFDQTTVTAPLTRVWYELAHEDGFCFLGASPTNERRKIALFSKRGTLTPIIQLAMRSDQADRIRPYLNADGEVDLGKLKTATDLAGAYTDTATYGQAIDDFLHAEDRTVILERLVELRHPFTLLEKARTDFIFVWPEQLTYFKRSTHTDFGTVNFRIAGSSAAQPYYAACSKGPMGRRAITRIDAVLDGKANWHDFVAPLKEWFPKADYERADRGVE